MAQLYHSCAAVLLVIFGVFAAQAMFYPMEESSVEVPVAADVHSYEDGSRKAGEINAELQLKLISIIIFL